MLEFFDAVFASFIGSGRWRAILQNSWLVVLLISAFVRGGGPEKIVICVWIFITQLNVYLHRFFETGMSANEQWGSVNTVSLCVDALMLLCFIILAVQANRQYLIWIAALQVVATMAHGVQAVTDEMSAFVYIVLVVAPGWLQIFIMTGGQIAHARRERGVYPDWRWQVARPATIRAIS